MRAIKTPHSPRAQRATRGAVRELSTPTQLPPLPSVIQRTLRDPRTLTRADVMRLQQTIGNVAVAGCSRE